MLGKHSNIGGYKGVHGKGISKLLLSFCMIFTGFSMHGHSKDAVISYAYLGFQKTGHISTQLRQSSQKTVRNVSSLEKKKESSRQFLLISCDSTAHVYYGSATSSRMPRGMVVQNTRNHAPRCRGGGMIFGLVGLKSLSRFLGGAQSTFS
jgi:hypothetical protein